MPSITTSTYVLGVTAAAAAAALLYTHRHIKKQEGRISKLEETRQAERKGRIRAEMKLRTHLKSVETNIASSDSTTQNQNDESTSSSNLHLQCIGKIVSPYTKRMGTPRQGALVPTGRGYIQLEIPIECVEGLELYSHAWIIFSFHANTDIPNNSKGSGSFRIYPKQRYVHQEETGSR